MSHCQANGTRIAYQWHADPADRPVIMLIAGLGMPLTCWPEALIDALVNDGFAVLGEEKP